MMHEALWLLGAPARWALGGLILLYRGTLGQLFPGRCRFHPTCSSYALDAVRTHGALKGLALAGWRIARCSPFTTGGIEPVPDVGTWRSRSVV